MPDTIVEKRLRAQQVPALPEISGTAPGGGPGGVQSIGRAFELLERLADAGGELGLSELASATGLPLPTIHRIMRTLVAGGYVRQEASRRYALGPRLIRLGDSASRMFGARARPFLASLADATGETANLALLDGDEVVYVAQVPSRHTMRTFTEVGRRVLPHSTAVGQVLLAQLPPDDVRALLARTGMPRLTAATVTDPEAFVAQLADVAQRGWAVDDGEHEDGVRCLAAVVPHPTARAAVSVSGPVARLGGEARDRIAPALTVVAGRLAAALRDEA
ncbi:IclR family transcriptional regulator [Uniformispora flossi]|uniref:IclR family transcriptional regulator n=1 Tax=Uniformispora flossi TaxID=3390723 RepID=UPI003C2DEC4C